MKKNFILNGCSMRLMGLTLVMIGSVMGAGSRGVTASETLEPPAMSLRAVHAAVGGLDRSLANEGHAALRRAQDWLAAMQQEHGGWSDELYPALTALPLWAFTIGEHPDRALIMERAVGRILEYVQPDGGIYRHAQGRRGGGLSNYNTALSMTALHATGNRDLIPVVLAARRFLAASQHRGEDIFDGGMGYDRLTDRAYADLNNTAIAYEAMRLTQGAEEYRAAGTARADLDWEAARRFLARLQHPVDADSADAGGFFYRPDADPKAGIRTNSVGRIIFRSYGSMTYAGMLSLIYADVSRDDPRVRSAFDWAMRHWTLDENPGTGPEGLYYFYNVLTKALAAYGRHRIPTAEGEIEWRREMVRQLVNLQRIDPATGHGYWVNNHGRYLEADPVLVTAYAVLALEIALSVAE